MTEERVMPFARRNEADTQQFQNSFETVLFQFCFSFVSVSFRCADGITEFIEAYRRWNRKRMRYCAIDNAARRPGWRGPAAVEGER